jgi:hypothetical protein
MIQGDAWRLYALRTAAKLDLPQCWIAAGFVRNRVWDALHGHGVPSPLDDLDVVYFDPGRQDRAQEKGHEAALARAAPGLRWSVKNQARMHTRNGDRPYRSTADALCHWCETATAVGVRVNASGELEILAPLGLADLLGLVVRPTPHARACRLSVYRERVARKNWRATWPRLRILHA